jgi:hypothetical protein
VHVDHYTRRLLYSPGSISVLPSSLPSSNRNVATAASNTNNNTLLRPIPENGAFRSASNEMESAGNKKSPGGSRISNSSSSAALSVCSREEEENDRANAVYVEGISHIMGYTNTSYNTHHDNNNDTGAGASVGVRGSRDAENAAR